MRAAKVHFLLKQFVEHRHREMLIQMLKGTLISTNKAAPVARPAIPAFNDVGATAKPKTIATTINPTEHPKITPCPPKNQPQKTFHKSSSPRHARFQDGSGSSSNGAFKSIYIGVGALMRFLQTIHGQSTSAEFRMCQRQSHTAWHRATIARLVLH